MRRGVGTEFEISMSKWAFQWARLQQVHKTHPYLQHDGVLFFIFQFCCCKCLVTLKEAQPLITSCKWIVICIDNVTHITHAWFVVTNHNIADVFSANLVQNETQAWFEWRDVNFPALATNYFLRCDWSIHGRLFHLRKQETIWVFKHLFSTSQWLTFCAAQKKRKLTSVLVEKANDITASNLSVFWGVFSLSWSFSTLAWYFW